MCESSQRAVCTTLIFDEASLWRVLSTARLIVHPEASTGVRYWQSCLYVCMSVCVPVCLQACLYVCLSVFMSVHMFIRPYTVGAAERSVYRSTVSGVRCSTRFGARTTTLHLVYSRHWQDHTFMRS